MALGFQPRGSSRMHTECSSNYLGFEGRFSKSTCFQYLQLAKPLDRSVAKIWPAEQLQKQPLINGNLFAESANKSPLTWLI